MFVYGAHIASAPQNQFYIQELFIFGVFLLCIFKTSKTLKQRWTTVRQQFFAYLHSKQSLHRFLPPDIGINEVDAAAFYPFFTHSYATSWKVLAYNTWWIFSYWKWSDGKKMHENNNQEREEHSSKGKKRERKNQVNSQEASEGQYCAKKMK